MGMKRTGMEFVIRDGRPAAVIVDIDQYEEMLERLEDLEDLEALREMRSNHSSSASWLTSSRSTIRVYEILLERQAERDLNRLADTRGDVPRRV